MNKIVLVHSSPSRAGKITEVFRKMTKARRILSACYSVAAIRARRDWLIQDHEKCMGQLTEKVGCEQ